jgi:hypothetical protein
VQQWNVFPILQSPYNTDELCADASNNAKTFPLMLVLPFLNTLLSSIIALTLKIPGYDHKETKKYLSNFVKNNCLPHI